MKNNMKEMGIAPIVIVIVVVVVAAAAAGGYFVMSGGGGGPSLPSGGGEENEPSGGGGGGGTGTVSSVDVTYSGYSGGELTGARIRAREIGSTTPDVRVDEVNGDQVFIYNNDEEAFYTYSGGENWTKYTGTMVSTYAQSWTSWASSAQGWALTHGSTGEYSVTIGDETATVNIQAINPTFDDSIFTPPADANVEEVTASIET